MKRFVALFFLFLLLLLLSTVRPDLAATHHAVPPAILNPFANDTVSAASLSNLRP